MRQCMWRKVRPIFFMLGRHADSERQVANMDEGAQTSFAFVVHELMVTVWWVLLAVTGWMSGHSSLLFFGLAVGAVVLRRYLPRSCFRRLFWRRLSPPPVLHVSDEPRFSKYLML